LHDGHLAELIAVGDVERGGMLDDLQVKEPPLEGPKEDQEEGEGEHHEAAAPQHDESSL
jgi:hypothetical protein